MSETHPAVEKHWRTFIIYVSHKVLITILLCGYLVKVCDKTSSYFACSHTQAVCAFSVCASRTRLCQRKACDFWPIQQGPRSNLPCDICIPD